MGHIPLLLPPLLRHRTRVVHPKDMDPIPSIQVLQTRLVDLDHLLDPIVAIQLHYWKERTTVRFLPAYWDRACRVPCCTLAGSGLETKIGQHLLRLYNSDSHLLRGNTGTRALLQETGIICSGLAHPSHAHGSNETPHASFHLWYERDHQRPAPWQRNTLFTGIMLPILSRLHSTARGRSRLRSGLLIRRRSARAIHL